MKKAFIALVAFSFVAPLFARDVEAIVTADWLEKNLGNSKVVVVDLRKVDDYKAGHIPGAISMLGNALYVPKAGLNNELPESDDLSDLIGEAGISSSSIIVVVETDGSRFSWATRVAWTFAYAGLDNVAVLSGGQAAWVKAGKAVSTDVVKAKSVKFTVTPRAAYLALKADVLKSKKQIIDARTYHSYVGLVKQGLPVK